jgi:hypothetical protein
MLQSSYIKIIHHLAMVATKNADHLPSGNGSDEERGSSTIW